MVSLAPSSVECRISKDDPDGEFCPIKHRMLERSNHVKQMSVDGDQVFESDIGLSAIVLGRDFSALTGCDPDCPW